MSQVPICVCHSKLGILHFVHKTSQSLDLNCPELTCLSITGEEHGRHRGIHPTRYSLNCPKLTQLELSSIHCTPKLSKTFALCAPHITLVQVKCDKEYPYDALTQFGSLKHLFLRQACNDIPPLVFQLPRLETLNMDGNQYAKKLEVRHPSLRELTIVDLWSSTSLRLNCPSLEAFIFRSYQVDGKFIGNLHMSYPSLRKVEIDGHYYVGTTNSVGIRLPGL